MGDADHVSRSQHSLIWPDPIRSDLISGLYRQDCPEWETLSEGARDMLSRMLVVDPEDRWAAEELLQHPWLQTCNKCV